MTAREVMVLLVGAVAAALARARASAPDFTAQNVSGAITGTVLDSDGATSGASFEGVRVDE